MKLLSTLSAVALALTLTGAAFAADDPPKTDQPGAQQQQNQPGTSTGDASQKERDYQAELKKCDTASDKQKCVDAAKKKFGQM